MGTGVVDTIMGGHYNPIDLAAVAVGFNIWLPLYLLVLGVLFANSTIIAQEFGAKNISRIKRMFPQALWMAWALGLFIAPLCYFSLPVIQLLELDAVTEGKANDYVQIVAFGLPATGLFHALRFHTQGVGITKPFAWASVIGFFANIPLNYMFIYGHWGAPELGAAGCGVATAISMWLSLAIIGGYILNSREIAKYLPKPIFAPPNWRELREILSVGLPIGFTFFLEVGVFSLIALLVGSLGEVAMASHQIAFNVWDMFYIPMLAIGTAMSTRIGHAIGAQDRDAVFRALTVGSTVAAFIALLTTFLLINFPNLIIGMYTDSTEIHDMAVRLLGLAALFILIDGIQIVGAFTLRAFKETRYPFIVMVVSYWLVALPLGTYLGLEVADNPGDGAAGFWYATISGIACCAMMVLARMYILVRRPLPKMTGHETEEISGMPDSITD